MEYPHHTAKALTDWVRKGAQLGDCGKMCTDCAFKHGTEAHSEAHTIEKATHALLMGLRFHCHTKDLEDAGKPCAGFLYVRQYFDHLDNNNHE